MGWERGVLGILLCLSLSGCVTGMVGSRLLGGVAASPSGPGLIPQPAPVVAPPAGATACAEPGERLTLGRALWLAQIYNPELAASSYEIRVRDAKLIQAALKPNPELGAESEYFGGTGDTSGSESTETTITLSQLIPLGGKIRKRAEVAAGERDLAGWDYEAKRLRVMTAVAERFVRVLVAREKLKLAREKNALAQEVYYVAERRFRAGDTSIVDKTRSQALLATSRIEVEKAGYELASARQSLAALWGSTDPKFGPVVGNLYAIRDIPQWQRFSGWISRNPDLARWATEISKRWGELRLAKAGGLPDLTASFGVRRVNRPEEQFGVWRIDSTQQMTQVAKVPGSNDTTLVAGLSFPLQVFDRNQGNVLAAKSNLAKGQQESRAAWVRVRTALALAYNALLSSHREAVSMKDEVIPALQQAFGGIRKGYREGKMRYLDLLEAQKSLIDERTRYIEALGSFHNARAELESLIGQSIGEIQ